jgi:outer membrane protein OmpA-like peptidoglycan-associated protein
VNPQTEGGWYELTVCERGEMKQDVEVSADQMQSALDADGHIALYIQFDTNKAVIKPESKSVIDEIVKLLGNKADLKVSIEGHTDSTGDPKKAKKLSEDRAMAVVTALTKAGVDKKRLKTAGWGATKPIADNDSDEGRAKNRRVELVKVD